MQTLHDVATVAWALKWVLMWFAVVTMVALTLDHTMARRGGGRS